MPNTEQATVVNTNDSVSENPIEMLAEPVQANIVKCANCDQNVLPEMSQYSKYSIFY